MRIAVMRTMLAAVLFIAPACGQAAHPPPSPGRSLISSAVTSTAPSPASPPQPGCQSPQGGFPASGTLAAPTVTALSWAPDGRLFMAERGGTVAVYQDGGLHTFATVATVTTEPGGGYSERGLLGLAISPHFTNDHYVYAFYSLPDYQGQVVARWTDCGGVGTDQHILIGLPSGSDCCHKGGRLLFGPDGMLYVSLGEEHSPRAAQDRSDVRGKVLRYQPDGTPAPGNPFGNAVWAYGLRNVFGMTFAPDGTLVATVNGPSRDANTPCGSCGDLVVQVNRGEGYQWPYCWGYGHAIAPYSDCGGQPDPAYSTEQTGAFVAPTGITWVDGRGPASLRHRFAFCSLSGGRWAAAASPHWTVGSWDSACIYDVNEGPDGGLYYSNDSAVHRLPPG